MNKTMLTSLGEYVYSNSFEWLGLAWQFASLSFGAWQFLHFSIIISQGSVETHLRFRDIVVFNYFFPELTAISLAVK